MKSNQKQNTHKKRPKSTTARNYHTKYPNQNKKSLIIKLDNVFSEINQMKKIIKKKEELITESRVKELIKSENLNISKENLIMALRRELDYHRQLNSKLNLYKQNTEKISNYYKKNYEDICKYRKKLREELAEFVDIIEKFNEKVENYAREKELLINSNQSIIDHKIDEQGKLKSKLDKLNTDVKDQAENIRHLMDTLRQGRNENINYLSSLDKTETEQTNKYESLLVSYKKLENQFKYYYDLEMQRRKNEMDEINENLYGNEKNNADLKLQEKKVRNDFLRSMVRDIKQQMLEIENQTKKKEAENKLFLLLGKHKAEKYKKKMEEKNTLNSFASKTQGNFTESLFDFS